MNNKPDTETPNLAGAIAAIEKRNGVGLVLTPHGELAKLERELGAPECVLRIETQPDLLEALQDIVEQFENTRLMVGADLADSIRVFGKAAIAKAEAQS